ncbi:MAG: hypothetical protein HYS12_16215 [Planctomycetes bacterium]|nr:hypothetical protein [Planctomycetota bacterium]
MATVRRALVLAALMFWQGGFTFYAAVVVQVGHEVLSRRLQGFVTRRVTNYLNAAGAVALPLLAWDAAARPASRRRALRWLCWGGLAVALALLVWLHRHLDALLDPAAFAVLDPDAFYPAHRWYLHVSTVQWACALAYGLLALLDWRDEDRSLPCPS